MTEVERMTAEEVVGYLLEGEGVDVVRESLTWTCEQLMEAEVSESIGAERAERAPGERLAHRNGYRPRRWDTRAGELELAIPKIGRGARVVRKCLVLAYGVHESGYREVIGLDLGECETEAFWRGFLRSLVERGLTSVQLVVSDAHAGLKNAIAQVLGCPWQRCSVHFLRETLGHLRKDQQGMVAALLRTDLQRRRRRASTRAYRRGARAPPAAATEGRRAARRGRGRPARLLRLPWRSLDEAALHKSAGTGEPRNRGGTDVVGIFPNDRSLIRLAASVVIGQNDEWLVGRRYLSNHSLETILDQEQNDGNNREETHQLSTA